MSSLLLIDKPSGISSAQVVAQVKRKLSADKVGHAGTLDPLATGLLVILIGSATRLANYALKGNKHYSGTILLGVTTTTDDIEGEVLTRSDQLPSFEQVIRAAQNFVGQISQVPPQISAVKISGRRAYEIARAGEEVEIKARQVNIANFKLKALSHNEVSFTVDTSPGTYIRSLARDLGAVLGCGATIKELRREASFPFDVSQAVKLEDLRAEHAICWSNLFPESINLQVEPQLAAGLLQGQSYLLNRLPAAGQGTLPGQYAIVRQPDMRPQSLLGWNNNAWELLCNLAL